MMVCVPLFVKAEHRNDLFIYQVTANYGTSMQWKSVHLLERMRLMYMYEHKKMINMKAVAICRYVWIDGQFVCLIQA